MIINDRDVLLEQAEPRFDTAGTGLILSGSSPTVRTAADGSAPSPGTITLTATLLGVTGTVAWSVSGGALSGADNTTRTLDASSMTGDVATVTVSLTYAEVPYTATYAIAKVRDGSSGAKGDQGDAGAPGIKSAAVTAYQWGNGPAPTIAGTSTYVWANATYDVVPASWSETEPAAPGPGFTLYKATVNIVESAGAAESTVDWTTAAIVGIGYMGTNGATGATGASAAIAYTLVDGSSLAGTPASRQESGRNLPTLGTWGETRAWTAQPSVPAANQSVFQSNGIYDPSADQITWGLPYLSNLRVGNLSALAIRTGSLIIDSIASENGNFSVDVNGNVVARAISIQEDDGTVILQAGSVLADSYVPPSAQNSQLTPIIQAAATTATWTGVSGTGKPQDNATVGANASNLTVTMGGDNLVNNSSFEQAIADNRPCGYAVYNNASVSTSILAPAGRLGGRAFGIQANAAGASTWGLYSASSISDLGTVGGVQGGWQPNKTYTLSFKAKKVNGAGFSLPTLQWNTAPSTVTVVTRPVLTTAWQTYTFRIVWGATVEGEGRFYIDCNNGVVAANDEFHIDDLIVQEGDVASEWFPSAREANAAIANISSDNVLSKAEKPQVMIDVAAISDEKPGLVTQCGVLGVDSGPYQTAYNALSAYLGSLSPAWNDTTQDTSIDGVTFRTKFTDYYTAKQDLVNDIASKASTMASGVTLNANGTLQGAGGGQVTLPGMGHNTYRVVTQGNSRTAILPAAPGLYINGALQSGIYIGRSYNVIVLDRSTGNIVSATNYDVYGVGEVGGKTAADMASDLNALTSDKIVLVASYDEPHDHRLDSGLDTAMYRCGASRAVYGSPSFKIRSAYVLVGIPGCGEGNGAEAYQGSVDSDPNAWVDVGFSIVNGILTGVSVNYRPRTLADYSYTGDLNATYGSTWSAVTGTGKPADNASADLVLVGRGVTVTGNSGVKTGGTAGEWDADLYSVDSFTGGAYASASPATATDSLMFGLNSDPTTDASYTSLDYAIYLDGGSGSALRVYESGNLTGTFGTYAAGDVFAVVYDGSSVKYLKNGTVICTSVLASSQVPSQTLFFDSSFNNSGGKLNNIRFGPLTSNNWQNVGGVGKPADYATAGAADAATALGFNPQFSNWTDSYPVGWTAWNGPAPVKETGTVRTAPYAVKYTVSSNTGMYAAVNFVTPMPSGSFLQGAYDINIITNNGGGSPGYLIRLFTNSSFTTFVDTIVTVPDKTVTGWQRVPFAARVASGQVIWGLTIYQMAAWSGMPDGLWADGSVCVFDNLTFDFYDSSTDNNVLVPSINSAATTATWSGVSGTGKPADNATVGAAFDVNISGQITSTNASTYIASAAIGSAQVGVLTAGNIAAGAITATQIASGTITSTQIAAGTITASNIATGTITASKIATGTITATQIAAHTVTATEISTSYVYAGSISANQITTGGLSADRISGGTITGVSINIGSGALQVSSGGSLSASGASISVLSTGNLWSPASACVSASSSGTGAAFSANGNSANAINITGGGNGIVQTGGGNNFLNTVNPYSDNGASLGTSGSFRWTALYATSSTITTSDARTKTDVTDSQLGLEFIKTLRPVSYRQVVAENVPIEGADVDGPVLPGQPSRPLLFDQRPGVRRHYGLIAQEVRAALAASGVDDAAIWSMSDVNDADSLQALRYEELISPIIRAVQELSSLVDGQRQRIEQLEQRSAGS